MTKTVKLSATGVEDEVLKRFKQLVIARYGSLRECMGKILTEAMMPWISKEENELKERVCCKR